MIKLIKIENWSMVEQAPESGKVPQFSVVIADSNVSAKPVQIKVPYNPVTDTTISPNTHDLFIHYDGMKVNARSLMSENIFFREKSTTDTGGASTRSKFSDTPIGTAFGGGGFGSSRKAIIDKESGSAITVSSKGVASGMPGKELINGKDGTLILGGSPKIPDFPSDDHLLFKETGIGRLMPRCFVPPFCMPAYLPNLQFIAQVAGTVKAFKEISKLTKRTF